MQITPLGSGSRGNCLLLQSADQQVLLDAGFALPELEARIAAAGASARSITAVCMTHRHRDHKLGVADFCRTHRTRVFGTRRTLRSLCNTLASQWTMIQPGQPFRIGHLRVTAVELQHDAPQTVGYLFDDGAHRFGYATDLGCADGAIRELFVGLDGLFLEFNHDRQLLARGPYPPPLRARIASDRGHLSNDQAAALLAELDHSRLRHLWLGHLSRHNNRPELARAAAQAALGPGYAGAIHLAEQDRITAPADLAKRVARPA